MKKIFERAAPASGAGLSAASRRPPRGRVIFSLLLPALCAAAFAQKVPIKNVAVIETQIDAASGAAKDMNKAEVREITTEIRRIAVNSLPKDRYQVMTSETVLAMGAEVLEECAEENCVIALGSKIGADYVVRGTISKFRQNFSLSIEMFETEYGMLVASAASVRTPNLNEFLEKGSEACAAMYKSFLDKAVPAAQQTAAPAKSAPAPAPATAAAPAPVPAPAPAAPPKQASAAPADFRDDKVGIDMVFVAGGTFTMGCTKDQGRDCAKEESPQYKAALSDFFIGKFEVTQKQWAQVMGGNPSRFKGENLPVESVSWVEVQEFITKLNELTGRKYRLPTEAEWEFAARGGDSRKPTKYSGSNNADEVAWHKANSDSTTHPVGSKNPNELGIYGMSGNVWEWTGSWFGNYTQAAKRDPAGPQTGAGRVIRGGSWDDDAWSSRVSMRYSLRPEAKNGYIGFRVALPVQ